MHVGTVMLEQELPVLTLTLATCGQPPMQELTNMVYTHIAPYKLVLNNS
jgi:hypothetical protein